MTGENLNIHELIELKQMPIIFYELEKIGNAIDVSLADLETMECTEENKSEVKHRRTEINNLNKVMEDKRKEIKEKILEGYNIFNEKYEEEIKSKLIYASALLKEKIDSIENEQKTQKENTLRDFANEYIKTYGLTDIVCYEDLKVNVTLSASEKSLKEDIKNQIESIDNFVKLIEQEEYADEIMIEYKQSFDFFSARAKVIDRHHQMQELELQRKERENKVQEEEKITEVVEEIIAPVLEEEIDFEELQEVSFTVWAHKDEILKIRDFIRELGVKYE